MAELADAQGLGPCVLTDVGVQLLSAAQYQEVSFFIQSENLALFPEKKTKRLASRGKKQSHINWEAVI